MQWASLIREHFQGSMEKEIKEKYLNITEYGIITHHFNQWWTAKRSTSCHQVAFYWTPKYINCIPETGQEKKGFISIKTETSGLQHKWTRIWSGWQIGYNLLLRVMIEARSKRKPSTCISITQYLKDRNELENCSHHSWGGNAFKE